MKYTLLLLFLMAMATRKPPDNYYPCNYDDFMWAVMMAESGGDTNARYVESNGEVSGGLFQMSVGDAQRYGCKFKLEIDLYNPIYNRDCAEKAMTKLRKMYPALSYQLALGKYWAVLRGTEWGKDMRPIAWGNFVKFAKSRGCFIQ